MALSGLYRSWNARINVISRKDIDNIEIHHVLHSLGIARAFSFSPGTRILDIGTGGGFPGIPLAIMFPGVQFTLVDSIGKKIRVVKEICRETGILNAEPRNERFEMTAGSYHYITGRAVTAIPDLWRILSSRISSESINESPNGMIYLKGGDFGEELKPVRAEKRIYFLSDWFDEPFFETKKLVHIYGFH